MDDEIMNVTADIADVSCAACDACAEDIPPEEDNSPAENLPAEVDGSERENDTPGNNGEIEALRAALAQAESENLMLRRKSVCADMGVPAALAEDIITLGAVYAERDGVSFEAAAQSVFDRLSGSFRGRVTTTGIMSEAPRDGDMLRKAFGLK